MFLQRAYGGNRTRIVWLEARHNSRYTTYTLPLDLIAPILLTQTFLQPLLETM